MSDKQPVLAVFNILGVRCQAALDSKEAALDWLDQCYVEDREGCLIPVMIIDENGEMMSAGDILVALKGRFGREDG